jgi:proteic killer suppression protein
MWVVDLSKVAKRLKKLPDHIREKLFSWEALVHEKGMLIVRKHPAFNDEPLKGNRKGQRSIRLNRSWRAIYEENENGEVIIIEVQEVHKHDY